MSNAGMQSKIDNKMERNAHKELLISINAQDKSAVSDILTASASLFPGFEKDLKNHVDILKNKGMEALISHQDHCGYLSLPDKSSIDLRHLTTITWLNTLLSYAYNYEITGCKESVLFDTSTGFYKIFQLNNRSDMARRLVIKAISGDPVTDHSEINLSEYYNPVIKALLADYSLKKSSEHTQDNQSNLTTNAIKRARI